MSMAPGATLVRWAPMVAITVWRPKLARTRASYPGSEGSHEGMRDGIPYVRTRRNAMTKTFDRAAQAVGNIVALEHVNVKIPSQVTSTAFYVVAMGFTRDPYLMVGLENMWINIGQQQIHEPTGGPDVLRGVIGIVMNDLEALQARLAEAKAPLADTKFSYAVENGHVNVTCPWGNKFRCHLPDPQYGDMTLGMPYVEFTVPRGTAGGIAKFYE